MTVTGRDRTDQEIVQEALRCLHARDGWVHSSENERRTDAVAALGRLVEARDTAQILESVLDGSACTEEQAAGNGPCGICVTCLRTERDTAIQERDIAHEQYENALTRMLAERARLERVEAALREIAIYPVGDDGFQDVARAALSDVTPPPIKAETETFEQRLPRLIEENRDILDRLGDE
jgi:hypothetical protein